MEDYNYICYFILTILLLPYVIRVLDKTIMYLIAFKLGINFSTLERICKKKCIYEDIEDITGNWQFNHSKKELLRFIYKNFPAYAKPYYWDLRPFESDPDVYENLEKQNESFGKKVIKITQQHEDFKKAICEKIDELNKKFWDEVVLKKY